MSPEPMFSILNDPIVKQIPFAAIAAHEAQAMCNHSQTLRGLNSRGGLSIHEAFYVMTDQEWPTIWPKPTLSSDAAFRLELMRLLYKFEKSRSITKATTHDQSSN